MEPVVIGGLCAVLGLCVHLAGWLLVHAAFVSSCRDVDLSAYGSWWAALSVLVAVGVAALAFVAGRSMRISGWRSMASGVALLAVLAPVYYVAVVFLIFLRLAPAVCG
jgi:hypothetical protein